MLSSKNTTADINTTIPNANPSVAPTAGGIAELMTNSLPVLAIGSMVGFMGYLFFSGKKPDSQLNRAIQLTKRLKECHELIGQHKEDIAKIREGLKLCNRDVIANNNEMKQLSKSGVPPILKHIHLGRLENRIDMADTLTNLLNQYPTLSMGALDDLNTSWNDWEEHHKQVVSLVEYYLPETYACLNESKSKHTTGKLVM